MFHHGTMAIISWEKRGPTIAMIIHPSKTGTPPSFVKKWLGLKIHTRTLYGKYWT